MPVTATTIHVVVSLDQPTAGFSGRTLAEKYAAVATLPCARQWTHHCCGQSQCKLGLSSETL